MLTNYRDRIVIYPLVCSTRITVSDILDYLAGEMLMPDIVADFLDLCEEDI